ncbi:amidoligase family protein [Ancylobacter lacus]|uniref:amidoligase family protein n=1 Tax=Ancylobacter lacus TaxID=2579970 RepID=UPI001BCC5C15|nr:amidoligase family protein [Ancylobacter lacus]
MPPSLPAARPTADLPVRRVGVEIEFTALPVSAAAAALADRFGGTVEAEDAHAVHLRGGALPDACIELDIRHVHPHRRAGAPRLVPPARAAALLGAAIGPFVPRELVLAPLPSDRLARIDEALATLNAAGARGLGGTLLDSLGLHFNIEQTEPDARRIAAVLKAFLLLEPWLRAAAAPDLAARLHLPPAYPARYIAKVLAPTYWPGLDELAADYLADNPTRKRALDLLPLLLHHGPRALAARASGKVKPRPSFHYRLPRAFVGRPGWSILPDWALWQAVERLAADSGALARLGAGHEPGQMIDGSDLLPG